MTSTEQAALVCATSLGVRYGATRILRDIDLEVTPGSQLALTGRSGSGKTTLLLALAGLLPPSEGTVTWPGLATIPAERRGQIGMVFQAPSLMPELTALENVTLPLRLAGDVDRRPRAAALSPWATWEPPTSPRPYPPSCSGGQQQRVAIARALAGGHRLVLADEPTGALDRAHAHEAALALREGVAATGGALVLATHDPELADLFDDQLAVADGTILHSVRSR